MKGSIPDYQMASFLMAVFFRGMTPPERTEWTRLMWKSGSSLPRSDRGTAYWVDKHSTGGVGDKTSLILVPLVSACAERLWGPGKVRLPMISGRGLGHTGGTLDKLEAVSGFSARIEVAEALRLLESQGFFMMGQTADIAPADRLLYSLRDVTATVESLPLIVSSILSKKLAASLDGLVLDVKCGEGAFMKDRRTAHDLAVALVDTAKANGVDTVAILTRMDEPLGTAAGAMLEVEECEDFFLNRERESGLETVTMELAAWMIHFASGKKLPLDDARVEVHRELGQSRSLALFRQMFESQGGDWAEYQRVRAERPSAIRLHPWRAPKAGFITRLSAMEVGLAVHALGGGRGRKEDPIDPWVGIRVHKKVGDPVAAGEAVFSIVHRGGAEKASARLDRAVDIAQETPAAREWILERVTQ